MANATSTQLQELYVAYFGRAADPTGLDYWTEKGISTSQFAADMYVQAEFKDVYGSLSTEAQVNQIYKNLFDREADVTGLNYWTLQINLGTLKLAEIANHLIWAAQNNDGSSDDKTALTNRANAAVAYTAKVKESTAAILAFQAETTSPWKAGDNITEAISYLSGIDKDTAHTDAGVAASVTTITNNGAPAGKKTFTLTTGVDNGSSFTGGSSADVFNANLDDSTNTLNAFDELDGGGGLDTLYADVKTAVTPQALTAIEAVSATFTGAVTFGLANATSLTTLSNVSSTENATFTGLAAGATTLKVQNIASDTTNFGYLSTTATDQSATVEVNNVSGASLAEISVDGIETLTFNAVVAESTYEIAADAATTLKFGGAADQTVTLDSTTVSVSNFDASAATGAVSITGIDQTSVSGVDITVTGGAGNDTLTTTSLGEDVSVSGGAGNDTITHTSLATTDTIDGGDGTDTLVVANADANSLDASTRTTFTNIEALTINNTFANDLTLANIASSLNTVNFTEVGVPIMSAAENIIGPAGNLTINIGAEGNSDGTMDNILTVTDTGSATTDTVTFANKSKTSGGANVDVTHDSSFVSTGYENVIFSTGAGTGADELDIGKVTITPDATTGTAVSLTVSGTNSVHFVSVSTSSTGLLTIDASGMTAQAGGTNSFMIDITTHGTGGTGKITGTSGRDMITTGNFATTLLGGGGNDTLTTGTASLDSIDGGAGNDTIDGGGGNDTLAGGDGNDTFTVSGTKVSVDGGAGDDTVNMDTTLSAEDTVTGGTGTDILAIDAAATASAAENVSGFEYLRADDSLTQDMVLYTGNSTFTRLIANIDDTVKFNNVGKEVTDFRVLTQGTSTGSTVFDRLLDNTSNSLTVGAFTDTAVSIRTLTVNDEETLTIDDGAITSENLIITQLNAEDLTTLNVTGTANVTVAALAAQTTATLTTVNASANTGTVSLTLSNATLAMTMTGAATAATTLVGGSGADTMTGGTAADDLTGGSGQDSITGGDGADSLDGGAGSDTLVGGAGADLLEGAGGANTYTGGTGADSFYLMFEAGNETIKDFDPSGVDLIKLDLSDIKALSGVTDWVELNNSSVIATSALTVSSETLGTGLDLAGSDTTASIVAFTDNFDSAAELQTALRDYLTFDGTLAAGDSFLVLYDNGTDTTLATATSVAAITGTVMTTAVVTDIATFEGVDDATDFGTADFLVVVA